MQIRTVNIIRYVTALREGGSLPAIAEADDGFLYVIKFRGAGQGIRSLIAELIGGEIARALGFKVPEIVFAHLDESFGRTEPDEEIQDLLKASTGVNIGLHYLSGSVSFDPIITPVDASTASQIVWLDSLLLNVDRTYRNTNILVWNKEIWLIDHGAALFMHHGSADWKLKPLRSFSQIRDHVLLPYAAVLQEADQWLRAKLTETHIRNILSLIPDEWLAADTNFVSADSARDAYFEFLSQRVAGSSTFVTEAEHARQTLI
jgi:hypothetical protein